MPLRHSVLPGLSGHVRKDPERGRRTYSIGEKTMNYLTLKKALLGGSLMAAMLFAAGTPAMALEDQRDPATPIPPMTNKITTKTESMKTEKGAPDRVLERTDRDKAVINQVERVLEPYSGLSIDAEQGTVFIRGSVDNTMDRNMIIDKTRSVNGVRDVNIDGLEVRQ